MKKLLLALPLLALIPLVSISLAPAQNPAARKVVPEFVGGPWLNTKDGAPITLKSRAGKPTLVAFWTFACENCQANLKPYARSLAKYRPKGVELIAIHTPELKIEHDLDEVKKHIKKFGIDYPVLVDADGVNWTRWKANVWPTLAVIDGTGHLVRYWEGELNWQGKPGEAEVSQTLDALLSTAK